MVGWCSMGTFNDPCLLPSFNDPRFSSQPGSERQCPGHQLSAFLGNPPGTEAGRGRTCDKNDVFSRFGVSTCWKNSHPLFWGFSRCYQLESIFVSDRRPSASIIITIPSPMGLCDPHLNLRVLYASPQVHTMAVFGAVWSRASNNAAIKHYDPQKTE